MKWRWLIPLMAIIFLWTLIIRAPAAYVAGWIMPADSPVAVYGIQGTLGSGRIGSLRYDQRPAINHLHWHLHPWKLLLGRLALRVDGGTGDPRVHGDVQLSLSTLRASNLSLNIQLKTLLTTAGYSFLPIDGLLKLDITRLTISKTRIDALQATGTLRSLRWNLGNQPTKLGDFKTLVQRTAKGGVKATLASTSGPLELSGKALLDPNGHYTLDLTLKPRPNAPKNVTNLLRPLGRPDATGSYHIHLHGQASWPIAAAAAPHSAAQS